MRILQIITRMDSIGGAQRHVVELSRAARDAGHEVHLAHGGSCAMDPEETAGIVMHEIGALKREISPAKDYAALRGLRRLIGELSPDLVATHSTKAGILGRLAAVRAKVCNVHTVHGWSVNFSGNKLKRFVYRQIESRVHRLADGLICVCEYDRRHALKMGLEEGRLAVIYNGRADTGEPEAGGRQGGVRIVSIGRLAWPKQPEQLLRFLVGRPEVELDLLGDGPREQEIRGLARELGVGDRVVFHGHVKNIGPVLSRGDVFALVSDWEGFPMSTLEAMAAGLPTVVSRVGGAPEAVEEGVTGHTIPRGDEAALHACLDELVADAAARRELGAAARALFLRRFQLPAMVEATLTYYRDCLARAADGPPAGERNSPST